LDECAYYACYERREEYAPQWYRARGSSRSGYQHQQIAGNGDWQPDFFKEDNYEEQANTIVVEHFEKVVHVSSHASVGRL
jgi:hypothetical protein